jgi:hypothetical protein
MFVRYSIRFQYPPTTDACKGNRYFQRQPYCIYVEDAVDSRSLEDMLGDGLATAVVWNSVHAVEKR